MPWCFHAANLTFGFALLWVLLIFQHRMPAIWLTDHRLGAKVRFQRLADEWTVLHGIPLFQVHHIEQALVLDVERHPFEYQGIKRQRAAVRQAVDSCFCAAVILW